MQNDIEQKFYHYQNNANSGWNYYVAYTEWFPADVKPVNVGWYITNAPEHSYDEDSESDYLWWWDGIQWTNKLHDNDFMYQSPCVSQNRKWRGLCVPIKNIIN